ncbi:MAG: hypothetical protein AAGD25_00420 [Cyanobacteria bacterium P01_F01_bin.150]
MAGLKIVESFDRAFVLEPESKDILYGLLMEASFCQYICQQKGCDRVEFTTLLFQPAPYTVNETKGMPCEYEQYYESPDYVIINVPPHFMFEAKIFKPNRLCAIYQIVKQESS